MDTKFWLVIVKIFGKDMISKKSQCIIKQEKTCTTHVNIEKTTIITQTDDIGKFYHTQTQLII